MKKIMISILILIISLVLIEDTYALQTTKLVVYQSSTTPQQLSIDISQLDKQFSFYGVAQYIDSDKSFSLVQGSQTTRGTVYFNERLSLDYDFEINLEISIFNKSGTVGDGLSVGFTQSPIGTIGMAGNGMGVINTINSTALIIDSYRNSTSEPITPNLSVRYTGPSADGTFRNAQGTAVSAPTPSVANGTVTKNETDFRNKLVPLEVKYTASTKTISYTLLGSTLSGSVANINSDIGAAFFVSSSTGTQVDTVKVFIKSGYAYLVTSDPTSLNITENENSSLTITATKPVYVPNASNKYPEGTILKIDGIEETFTVNSNGDVVIPKNQRLIYDTNTTITFTEESKGESSDYSVFIPGYKTRKPVITYEYDAQDGIVLTILRDDNTPYPSGTEFSLPGISTPFTISNTNTFTIPKSSLPTYDTSGSIIVTENSKESSNALIFITPGSKTNKPAALTSIQDIDSNVVITPRKPSGALYPEGTVLTSPSISAPVTINNEGSFVISRSILPNEPTDTVLYFTAPHKDISDAYDIKLLGVSSGPKEIQKANLESIYNALKSLIEESSYLNSTQKDDAVLTLTTIYDEGQLALDDANSNDELSSIYQNYKKQLEDSALMSARSGNLLFVQNYVDDIVTSKDSTVLNFLSNAEIIIDSSTTITEANQRTENILQQIAEYVTQQVNIRKSNVNLELLNFAGNNPSDEVQQIIEDALALINSQNYNDDLAINDIIEDAKAAIAFQDLSTYKNLKIAESNNYIDNLVNSIDPDLQQLILEEQDKMRNAENIEGVDNALLDFKEKTKALIDSKVDEEKTNLENYLSKLSEDYPNIDPSSIIADALSKVTSMNYNNTEAIDVIKDDALEQFKALSLANHKQTAKVELDQYVSSLVTLVDADLQTIINNSKNLIDEQTTTNEINDTKDDAKSLIDAYLSDKVEEAKSTYADVLVEYAPKPISSEIETLINNFKNEVTTQNYNNDDSIQTLINNYKQQIDNQDLLSYKEKTKNDLLNYTNGLVTSIDDGLQSVLDNINSLIDILQTVAAIDAIKATSENEINNYLKNAVQEVKDMVSLDLGNYAGRPFSNAVRDIINNALDQVNSLNYTDEDEITNIIENTKVLIDQQLLLEFKKDSKDSIDQYVDEKTTKIDDELQVIIDNGKTTIDTLTDYDEIKEEKNRLSIEIDQYIESKINEMKNELNQHADELLGEERTDAIDKLINDLLDTIDSENYNNDNFAEEIKNAIEDAIAIHLNSDKEASMDKVKISLENYAGMPLTNEIIAIIDQQKAKVNEDNFRDIDAINAIILEGKTLIDAEKLRAAKEDKLNQLRPYLEGDTTSDVMKEIIQNGFEDLLDSTTISELETKYQKLLNDISLQAAKDIFASEFTLIYEKYVNSGRYSQEGLDELKNLYKDTLQLIKNDDLSLSDAVEILNSAEVRFANIKTTYLFSDSFKLHDDDLNYDNDSNEVYMSVANKPGFTFGTTVIVEKLVIDKELLNINKNLSNFTKTYHPFSDMTKTYDFDKLKSLNVILGLDINLYNESNVKITSFEGEYIVSFLITTEMKNMENFKIIYTNDEKLEVYETSITGDWLSFKTTHFSEFYVMGSKVVKASEIIFGWILIIMLLVIIAELVIIFLKKRHDQMKVRSIVLSVFLFIPVNSTLGTILVVILGIIIVLLFAYIIYLFLLKNKYPNFMMRKSKMMEVETYYNFSFMGLLHQTTKETKEQYKEIVQFIEQFPQIKAKLYWDNQSFIYNKCSLFRLSIYNNTLMFHVPRLDMGEFEDLLMDDNIKSSTTKLNVSTIKKIILKIATKHNLKMEKSDYKSLMIPYKTTEELIHLGLVKKEKR